MNSDKCRDCKFCKPCATPIFWFSESRWKFSKCSHPMSLARWSKVKHLLKWYPKGELPYSEVEYKFGCQGKFFEAKPPIETKWQAFLSFTKFL